MSGEGDTSSSPTGSPEDAAAWDVVEEATERLAEDDVTGAIEELERQLPAHETNPYVHYFLGQARFEQRDFGRALRAYVRALELRPGYRGALLGTGHTLRLLGRSDEALKVGRELLRRDDADADAHYLLGLLHFARDERPLAVRHLTRFLELGPEVEAAIEVRGMLDVLEGHVAPIEDEDT